MAIEANNIGLAQNYAVALAVAIGLVYAVFYQMNVHTEVCLMHVITVASVALGRCSNGFRQTANTVALISNGINLVLVSTLTFSVTYLFVFILSFEDYVHGSRGRIMKTYLPIVYSTWIYPDHISDGFIVILNHVFMVIAFGALQWVTWLAHKDTKVSPQSSAMYTAILYGILDALPFILELFLVISFVYKLFYDLINGDGIHIRSVLIAIIYALIHALVVLILAPAAAALTIAAKFTRRSVFYSGALISNGLRILLLVVLLVVLGFVHVYYNDVSDYHITIGRDQAFPGDSVILILVFNLAFYGFFEYVIWTAYKDNDSSGQVAPTRGRSGESKPSASSQGMTTVRIDVAKKSVQPKAK